MTKRQKLYLWILCALAWIANQVVIQVPELNLVVIITAIGLVLLPTVNKKTNNPKFKNQTPLQERT